MSEPEPEASGERFRAWIPALAFAVVALTLVAPAAKSGLWDPFELRSIELGRRIAVGLFHADALELGGAENALPTRGEVDRGELPFTSMALGLKLFGLHAWAARLPLVLFALAGLGVTYLLARRLSERRSAVLAVLVLGTMPLYFLHARTLLGDVVTMAGQAGATAGLTLALFDGKTPRLRAAWLGLATLGIATGLMSRGLLLGVSVPLVGAGLAWLVLRLAGALERERATDALGASLLGLGALAALLGTRLLGHALAAPERYFLWLGFGVTRGAAPPTFDALIGVLGHALFPWSALVPMALGRVAVLPASFTGVVRARESALRLSLALTALVGFAAWAGVAPFAGVLPYGPVACLALLVALALGDIDRGAPASRALGMTSAALVVLLVADFINLPEKTLAAFGVEGVRFPESFRGSGVRWLLVCAAGSALGVFVGLLEETDPERPAFARRDYAAWLTTLRDQWNGNLLFGACVVEAGLLGFLAFGLLGERIPALARFVPADAGSGLRLAWLIPPLVLLMPLATLALRDAMRFIARQGTRGGVRSLLPSRGMLSGLTSALGALCLSLGYYPKLVAQLSPEGTFEAFQELAGPHEELGLLGTSSASAPYAVGRPVTTLASAERAFDWLVEPGARRWLVLKADSLNGMNSRYRELGGANPRNLPILDGRSSEVLLASNRLLPGEHSQNPLDRYLLERLPQPTHPLDASLGGQLDVLGWDVTDLDGVPVRSVVPARRYEFVVYFRSTARVIGTWETFVHIDGFQRRFNADHPTLDGHYPFSLWHVGDLLADRHEFTLEPNFTRGTYQVYLGLYSGAKRLPVTRGTATDDRLHGGDLVVD